MSPSPCCCCHLFAPSLFIMIQGYREERWWGIGATFVHISETETLIKQLVCSSCGVPQPPHSFPLIHTTVLHCLLSVCCDFLVAAVGALAYRGEIISTY